MQFLKASISLGRILILDLGSLWHCYFLNIIVFQWRPPSSRSQYATVSSLTKLAATYRQKQKSDAVSIIPWPRQPNDLPVIWPDFKRFYFRYEIFSYYFRPSHGGKECPGRNVEYDLCNKRPCPNDRDFRADQCMYRNNEVEYKSQRHKWLPYEPLNGKRAGVLTYFRVKISNALEYI